MLLDVSPTRMELLRLKKKLLIARRGHKLLKDKLDELVRRLLALVREVAGLRGEVNGILSEARDYLAMANDPFFPEALSQALEPVGERLSAGVTITQVLNIHVPEFTLQMSDTGTPRGGFTYTSAALDRSMDRYRTGLENLVVLSHKEKSMYLIAAEIQRTRRRVNALEYILIPNIEETIAFISMKLDELERNTKAQLMRIKDVVRAPKAPTSAYPGVGKYSF